MPEPFEKIGSAQRTDIKSVHNKTRAAKASLHSPTLSGILAYMELEIDPAAAKGAIGTQAGPSCSAVPGSASVYLRGKGKE